MYKIDHNLQLPIDKASGAPIGRRQHSALKICKKIDATSPLLYEAMTSAEQLECDLKLYDWGKGVEKITIQLN